MESMQLAKSIILISGATRARHTHLLYRGAKVGTKYATNVNIMHDMNKEYETTNYHKAVLCMILYKYLYSYCDYVILDTYLSSLS